MTTIPPWFVVTSQLGGVWYGHAELSSVGSAAWPTLNLALYMPIYIPKDVTVGRVVYMGTTSPPTMEIGVYDCNTSWMPNNLLVTTSSFVSSSGSQPRSRTITATALVRGSYYIATVVTAAGSLNRVGFGGGVHLASSTGLLQEATGGSLPSTATGVATTNAYAPQVGLVVSGITPPF